MDDSGTKNIDSALLVLTPDGDKNARKTFQAKPFKKISDYDDITMWKFEVVQGEFHEIIRSLLARENSCLVLGAPRKGIDTEKSYRRLKFAKEGISDSTIIDRMGDEMVLDLDDIEIPNYDPLTPVRGIEWVLNEIGLSGVKCTWQITGSQKLNSNIARLRLYLRSSKVFSLQERKRWAKALKVKTDLSMFTCNQVIYTSPPLMVGGDDPIQIRSGTIDGAETFKLIIPDKGVVESGARSDSAHSNSGDDDWCELIMDGDDFHSTIRDNTVKLARKKLTPLQITSLMKGLMNEVAVKDERWQERYDNIESLVDTAYDTLQKPQPMPFFEGSTKEPPLHCLPKILRDAVTNCAEYNEVPTVMSFGAGLAASSIAIGNSVKIIELDGLEHFLVLHIVCIGGTGERKSPTYKYYMLPIHEKQKSLEEKFSDERKKYQLEKEIDEKTKSELIKIMSKEAASGNPVENKALRKAVIEINKRIAKHEVEKSPRLIIANATEEEAIVACHENDDFIGIGSPDGKAVVDLIEGKYRVDADGAGFIINSAVGDPVDYHRRGSDTSITMPNPASALLLMIQGKIAKRFRKNDSLIDLGLFARLIFLSGSSRIGSREWGGFEKDEVVQNKLHDWMNNILDRRTSKTQYGQKREVKTLTLSKGARKVVKAYFAHVEQRMDDDPLTKEFINKAPSMAVKIAGIFHMFDALATTAGNYEVSEQSMSDAVEVMKYLISVHLEVVFKSETEIIYDHARELLGWLTKSEIRFEEYQRYGFTMTEVKDLTDRAFHPAVAHALMGLTASKWLTKVKNKGGARYHINFEIDDAVKELKRKSGND